MIAGMNFAWCGQSCGSTSRAFLHEAIHDRVLREVKARIARVPSRHARRLGHDDGRDRQPAQYDRIAVAHRDGQEDGATLVCGGGPPDIAGLAGGLFVEPTVFADVTPTMTIAREEIFGPVLSVLRWSDEAAMLRDVNALDVGLTCSIWTHDLDAAHRTAHAVEAGYVWVNEVGRHFLGAPFGGVKQSGIGREECHRGAARVHPGEEHPREICGRPAECVKRDLTRARHRASLVALTAIHTCNHAALAGGRVAASLDALQRGASPVDVGILMAGFGILPMLCALHAGRLIDRIGVGRPLVVGTTLSILSVGLPWLWPSLASLYVAALMLGLGFMLSQVAVQRAVGELGSVTDRPAELRFSGDGLVGCGLCGDR